jgi:hypothetical protein
VNSENSSDTYQGLLGLDATPSKDKFRNSVICLIIVTWVSAVGFHNINGALLPNETPWLYVLLAFISPGSIALGVLRLMGLKWWVVFVLFIVPPVAFWILSFLYFLFAAGFMAT